MKRSIAWFLSAAVLLGLVAGIYFLTLSANLALAEEKVPAEQTGAPAAGAAPTGR